MMLTPSAAFSETSWELFYSKYVTLHFMVILNSPGSVSNSQVKIIFRLSPNTCISKIHSYMADDLIDDTSTLVSQIVLCVR